MEINILPNEYSIYAKNKVHTVRSKLEILHFDLYYIK